MPISAKCYWNFNWAYAGPLILKEWYLNTVEPPNSQK
jgi:hypothetical protein